MNLGKPVGQETIDALNSQFELVNSAIGNQLNELMKLHEKESNNTLYRDAINKIYNCFALHQLEFSTFAKNYINQTYPEFQFRMMHGNKVVRILHDFINVFERKIEELRLSNELFNGKITTVLSPMKESVELNWKEKEEKIKNGLSKKGILSGIERRRFETSIKRRALKKLGWISKDDANILEFIWHMRNTMHNDFIAQNDYNLNLSVQSKMYSYQIRKDNIVKVDLEEIFVLTKKLSAILLKICGNNCNVHLLASTKR